jgi:hypothetical protein
MKLTEHLPADRRSHVEARLQGNLMAWLYVVKYTERIGAMFGAADKVAALFSTALLITPRIWA